MTFIGVRIREDFAEIVTDTRSYWHNLRRLGQASKVVLYPHLDAAIAVAGDGYWSYACKSEMAIQLNNVESFDEAVSRLPHVLRNVWHEVEEEKKMPIFCNVILVGYSPSRDRFVGFDFQSGSDFNPIEIEKIHVQPAPWNMRRPQFIIDAIIERLEADFPGHEGNAALRAQLESADAQPNITDMADWVGMARFAREQRTLSGPFERVLVDGKLYHHKIQVSMASVMQIWDFAETDPDGEEFKKMVADTLHPSSQLGLCPCGESEGRSFLEHCLQQHLDEPCSCGTSKLTIRECCMVGPDADDSIPVAV